MKIQDHIIHRATESDDEPSLGEYLAALKRRRGLAIKVMVVVLIAGVTVIGLLPTIYRSSGTILIEQQEIPADYVRSTVTTYADQRIQTISARVMTTANLLEVIRKYGLYEDERGDTPPEIIVEHMREQIELETISAEVVDPRSGRPTDATIAFTISFASPHPVLAQRVANELASLFLNENLRTRRQMAVDTAEFLAGEEARLEGRIDELERQLADFKQRNAGDLPELTQLNLTLLDRTERELIEVERTIAKERQDISYINSELADTPATLESRSPVMQIDGKQVLAPADQLRILETRLASLSVVYTSDHPDLVRTRREVEALRKVTTPATGRDTLSRELQEGRAELARARERYAPEHPDVVRLVRTVDSLESLLASASQSASTTPPPGNPAYVELKARLAMSRTQLASMQDKRTELVSRRDDFEARLARAPAVEQEYRALVRDHENALAKYQEVTAKRMEAQIAQSLESEQKAERFTLIEPPLLPESPAKPNRLLLLGLLGMFAMALAIGAVALAEALDRSVRGVGGVTAVLGVPPLAAIPVIVSPDDRRAAIRRHVLGSVGALSVVAAAIAVVHVYYMPLDVVLYSLINRVVG